MKYRLNFDPFIFFINKAYVCIINERTSPHCHSSSVPTTAITIGLFIVQAANRTSIIQFVDMAYWKQSSIMQFEDRTYWKPKFSFNNIGIQI